MKKMIVIGILGMVLVSLASAGLLDIFGKIEGEVVVSGPVFYAAYGSKLLINEIGGSYLYILNDANDKIFLSTDLDKPLDFYKPKLTLYVKANLSEGIEPKNLDLEFLYIDTNDNVNHICNGPISVSVHKGDLQNLSGSCVGTEELKDVEQFRYVISGLGDNNTKYKIKVDGYTRVEMDRA